MRYYHLFRFFHQWYIITDYREERKYEITYRNIKRLDVIMNQICNRIMFYVFIC